MAENLRVGLAAWRNVACGLCATGILACSGNSAPGAGPAGAAGSVSSPSPTAGGAGPAVGGDSSSGGSSGSGVGGVTTDVGGTGGLTSLGGSGGTTAMVTAPMGKLPNGPQSVDKVDLLRADWRDGLITPTFEAGFQANQPIVVQGFLQLAGNAEFVFYDLEDPTGPKKVSTFASPGHDKTAGPKNEGEAESHQLSLARYGNRFYQVTTAGKGVDIWNISDPALPTHVKQVPLEGVDYGDFTEAVWGLGWQGDTIYIGGTNTGLHILDATDPENVTFVKRIPTSAFGGVSAGPLWAIGNYLVITTPKESAGIATLDISDPHNPVALDFIKPAAKSYIGALNGHHLFLQDPLRAWDVLSDPTDIGAADAPFATLTTEHSEYMSFSDGHLFLGHALPDAGVSKVDIRDMQNMKVTTRVWGRLDLPKTDDQFTLPIGNLVVMTDDQHPYHGTTIGVHAAAPDTTPPRVDTVIPKDGATAQSRKSRVGISLTDNIELATVHPESFILRPQGGAPVAGKWGLYMGVVNFDPDQELEANTTYEVVLPAGGMKDLVGNGIAAEFKSTFTTK